MSSVKHTTRELQRAKRSLLKKYGECGWFHGVGIVPSGDGPALRLNVDREERVDEEIPDTYYNIPVHIVRISGYKTRKG